MRHKIAFVHKELGMDNSMHKDNQMPMSILMLNFLDKIQWKLLGNLDPGLELTSFKSKLLIRFIVNKTC